MIHRAVAQNAHLLSLTLVISLLLTAPVAQATSRDQAKRIHDRIAGVPPDATMLDTMAGMVAGGDALGAALLATQEPGFYNVTLKQHVTPWTNEAGDGFAPLNDYTATVIGLVRDNVDFRQILTTDVLYVGSGAGIPPYSASSNAHYEALETNGVDLSSSLSPVAQSSLQGIPANAAAGVLTSRQAARAFLVDGTNRAMLRFTFRNHLCRDLEQIQDTTRIPDRIRQDVSRSPGGDSRIFLNGCIGCHAGMDPFIQSFAYYDYAYDKSTDPDAENGALSYNAAGDSDPVTGTRVKAKYFNNNTTFAPGYVTVDDHWDNYWRTGPNALLGWDSALTGNGDGARGFGEEISHADAFTQCHAERVFTTVCLRPPEDAADRAEVTAIVADLRANGYSLRRAFAQSAVYCMGE
ncbi:MAG: hypothetical protein R3E84_13990 [Pseudomonadales bacterium]